MRFFSFFLLFFVAEDVLSVKSRSYKDGEVVELFVNKAGPYYNPHETYLYYSLPVCRPSSVVFKSVSLGEVLDGDRPASSLYRLHFKKQINKAILCHKQLSPQNIETLVHAIEDFYLVEFIIDNVAPVHVFIGNLEESKMLPHTHRIQLYTHHDFQIYFNVDKIVHIGIQTVQSDPLNLLTVPRRPINVTFTYTVNWIPTIMSAKDFQNRHLGERLPRTHEIHWISITNSLILVFLLLTFIMFIISRILRQDFARYNQTETSGEQDERGWKMVHNDVFRPPGCSLLFCAIVGTGCQLVTIALGIVIMALFNMFNVHNHGVINIAALILYSLTCWIAGFISCRLHKRLYNTQSVSFSSTHSNFPWVHVVNITSAMFGLPLILVWFVSNTVSVSYGTTHAIPISTIIFLGLIWLLLGYPLTIAGGMLGKRTLERIDSNGCRARNIAREIPPIIWYKSRSIYLMLGGFLPFSSICIELYYIFATLWGREHYNLYGVLLIIFIILLLVTVCVSINITYFQLVSEDYRWWWNTLQLAAYSSLFIFLYCIFHFFYRSKMSGFVQTVEFFSYSLLICYAFFLGLGAVSFIASFCFIKFMYHNIKLD